MEIWRPVVGYEGIYEVSSHGRIRGKDRYVNAAYTDKRLVKGRMMKTYISYEGYEHIDLSKEGKKSKFLVHRIVAQAFIPNPENKGDINHIDGNKLNNHINNLEWNTRSENIQHAFDNGLNKVYQSTIEKAIEKTSKKVYCHQTDKVYNSMTQAAKELDISMKGVSAVCRGLYSKVHGYSFEIVKDD